MPFNATIGVSFIKQFKNYLQFQSTLAFLANPPKTSYGVEPVDLMKGLDEISETAESGGYANHYEFEAAIRVLIRRAHDGHLNWQSQCLEGTFYFVRDFYIVALTDSPEDVVPKIYEYNEIEEKLNLNISHTYNISAISQIDGVPVLQYLSDWIETNDQLFSDPDARWNSLFARNKDGFSPGAFYASPLYLGDSVKLTFENGTKKTVQWQAYVSGNFTGITNGEDLYKNCLKPTATSTPASVSTPTTSPTSDPTPAPEYIQGYPKTPLYVAQDGSISAYNIDKTGIIAIHTFAGFESQGRVFQNSAKTIISRFREKGIAHIIFDVSGNGGGNIVLAYEMFKQFFPNVDPFIALNMRAHPAAKVFLEVVSDQINNSSLTEEERRDFRAIPFAYYYMDDINGTPYRNWEELYGPIENYGDTFTNYSRWNIRDKEAFAMNFTVTNGDMMSNSTSPWTANDIIIVGDGLCASTCSYFVELMTQVGVRTVAYGGRPQSGPMQMLGGTEGSLYAAFSTLKTYAQDFALPNNPEKAAEWSEFLPGPLDIPPFRSAGGVNLMNSFGRDDLDTPLDFIYTPANFRGQMSKDYFRDSSNLWKDVITKVWSNGTVYRRHY
ncbi:uncharacterized protein H6S33_005703 [Morchella sextelata]|uniref:uncharacterized protein n=1 Tax=Morchella sextelata TaxID=1174677 RepID=UPI001D043F15|nr:uncharacterized protein H6S33_005703 [Morchella sextelata]KAH0613817.1 hypothetical protein H6S33_005703 [Morchella sextelata]